MAFNIIPCRSCGKMLISVREIPDTVLIQRGFTGRKGKVFHRGRDVYLTVICPACGQDQRKAEKISHEEHLKRIKESGMPTRIGEDGQRPPNKLGGLVVATANASVDYAK